ncbi:HAD family hydrolase [Blautia sp. MSJ-19]|uniref:HAD family hydrolase n=1 Tax=Blautia sp. MSJ-19 TaxID=2841517 RepID=UPI001C0F1DE8|nr:HAD family phosphatase [Blautia sp. MSJ-19]MBU5479657.1 HAD family phosphatase [Blautia sp. MSJ-19]
MKNWKKYAAIIAVIALLAIFCLPMYFALKGDFSQKEFMASLFTVMFVAVMCYVILMLFKYLNRKKEEQGAAGMIKNVIFDVGLVLVEFNWQTYLDSFGFEKEKRDRIAKATFQGPVWDERDRGVYDEETYVRQCQELDPEYAEDIARVMKDTPKTIHRMPYAETWTKYLKSQGYHLYILSNYSKYMLDRTQKEMPFRKYMDGDVFSCDVRQLKPEAEIYRTLLDKYQLKPEECVFIDDREVNCKGAENLGIRTICFKNFKQAAAELEKMGVK